MNAAGKGRFWLVQVSGWLLLTVFNYFVQKPYVHNHQIELVNNLCLFAGGMGTSSAYRWYLKRFPNWLKLRGLRLISFIFATTAILTLAWFAFNVLVCLVLCRNVPVLISQMFLGMINLFLIILVWNLFYLIYHLIKQRFSTDAEMQLAAELEKAQMAALRTQLNPHFLFNTLNNIRALILEDPEMARRMVTQFSELMRYSLQYAERREVPLVEELDVLHRYLELLKIQFETRLEYTEQIDQTALDAQIPPMILQLLVENAVKHGISALPEGGTIALQISSAMDSTCITLSNTGSLQRSKILETSLGLGLQNIRKRLLLIYGTEAQLDIAELGPKVVVTVKIPRP